MPLVLVVEDSTTQALEIRLLLEDAGFAVAVARNGAEGLEAVGRTRPDVVLTDLDMPVMNGLELVAAVRSQHPTVPVVLMTALGSEEIAAQALQKGASSYVPKKNLGRDIVKTLRIVMELAGSDRKQRRILDCWTRSESHFLLDNDPALVPSLIGLLSENLSRMKLCDETGLIRVGVALSEALTNAIRHGNLEVSSELRERDDDSYFDLAEERRRLPPYRDRRVHVVEKETPTEVRYVIRDEGPGFDPSQLPDPADPANIERASGRGLLLIRAFMDDVRHNATGNEITLIKRRDT